jgi:hypothetical protein
MLQLSGLDGTSGLETRSRGCSWQGHEGVDNGGPMRRAGVISLVSEQI